ncbi:MAG: DUF308 domain-containing protein [Candidatus Saccharimonadales bacterium]
MAKGELEVAVRDRLAGTLVAQGVLAMLFGIVVLVWPGLSATLFVSMFGILVLLWGLVSLVRSFLGIGRISLWWLESLFSLLAIGLGVYLLRNPEVTGAVLIMLVAFTLIGRGVVDFVVGLFSKEQEVLDNRWFYIVIGVIGVVLGAVVLAHPVTTGLVFVWAFGLYLVLSGAVSVGLAFRVRS